MRHEILRMQRIKKNRGINIVFDQFHLNIFEGEILGLCGCAFSGKTTLADILTGKEEFEGIAFFDELPIEKSFKRMVAQKKIFGLYESSGLIGPLTIAENMQVINSDGRSGILVNKKRIATQAQIVLDFFDIDVDVQQQASMMRMPLQHCVMLIKSVTKETKLVVIDDTTASYTAKDIALLHHVLQKLSALGVAVLYISHSTDDLSHICDRIVILRNGRNIRTFCKNAGYKKDAIQDALYGAKPDLPHDKIPSKQESVVLSVDLLEAEDLKISGLQLHHGEIIGFFDAQNKHNLLLGEVLSGRKRAKTCDIHMEGRHIHYHDVKGAMRQGIGMLPEDYMISYSFNSMPLLDNIVFLLYGRMKKMKIHISRRYLRMIEQSAKEKLCVQDAGCHMPLKEYDFYKRQQALLYRWLLFDPKVMICVNPMFMVDTVSLSIVRSFLNKLTANKTGVLLLSSDQNTLGGVCDRIIDISEYKI
ncbi:MAG: ATP-binding cassette domain-containing protein [Christensenellales bacterium]|jgi:ABC-type sugar transport system ATPase subunit